MNPRAFACEPILSVADGTYYFTMETLNWCGHPAFGTTVQTREFDNEEDVLHYALRLGFEF
jgi:hypothetical protein